MKFVTLGEKEGTMPDEMSDADLIVELLDWADSSKHHLVPSELRRLCLIAADRINHPTPDWRRRVADLPSPDDVFGILREEGS